LRRQSIESSGVWLSVQKHKGPDSYASLGLLDGRGGGSRRPGFEAFAESGRTVSPSWRENPNIKLTALS